MCLNCADWVGMCMEPDCGLWIDGEGRRRGTHYYLDDEPCEHVKTDEDDDDRTEQQ